jgi:hypothetical protein
MPNPFIYEGAFTADTKNLLNTLYTQPIVAGPIVSTGLDQPAVSKFIAAGAIPVPIAAGAVCISGASVLAMTLAANPVAGSAAAGGEDGKVLFIFNDTAAKNHTVTGQTNAIQGSLHIITMATTASMFSSIALVAFAGSWWPVSNYNCVIS